MKNPVDVLTGFLVPKRRPGSMTEVGDKTEVGDTPTMQSAPSSNITWPCSSIVGEHAEQDYRALLSTERESELVQRVVDYDFPSHEGLTRDQALNVVRHMLRERLGDTAFYCMIIAAFYRLPRKLTIMFAAISDLGTREGSGASAEKGMGNG
jgi:hypothetical protein